MNTRRSAVKLTVFLAACAFISAYVALFIGEIRFDDRDDYSAVFDDASGLEAGSPVRIAGVQVGSVRTVGIHDGSRALITFDLDDDLELSSSTRLAVRYKNLIGDRYLELSREPDGHPVPSGTRFTSSHTSAALDLDTLLDGFHPLFQGLDARQINRLSIDLVRTLQGESGTIQSVLSSVASLTGELADRDQVVGQVIDNLRTFLGIVAKRSPDLDSLIVNTQELITGLDDQRDLVGDTIEDVAALGDAASGLLADTRPDLRADVSKLRKVSTTLARNKSTLQLVLTKLPDTYGRLARYGSYGSFFNFYVCALRYKFDGPNGPMYSPYQRNKADRCQG